MTTILSAHFFQSCLRVFQGGSVGAFVGALGELEQRKVDFAAVAGTSVGSIMAVLVGTGANSSYLQKALGKLDFLALLVPPENVALTPQNTIRGLGLDLLGSLSQDAGNAVKILRYHGLCAFIDKWSYEVINLKNTN